MPGSSLDLELARDIGKFYADPLGFVKFALPWGEKGGPLEKESGPDAWQEEVLRDIGREVRNRRFSGSKPVDPIRVAIASGHGIGKSTLAAWLVIWIMSTRPLAKGTVSANTLSQLRTKTWAQIQRWARMAITSH